MKKVRCPVCDRLMQGTGRAEWPEFPFCSPRCRLVDLGRWLGGTYTFEQETTEADPEPAGDEYSIP
jgi:endogenous inhibitor of DNA gyrase (YacG/DUF329 family)